MIHSAFKIVTKQLAITLSLVAMALAAATVASCSKSASPPTDFGVNVTIDAHGSSITATVLASISKGKLNVTGAESVSRDVDVAAVLKSAREARFHFQPADSVKAADKLTLSFDVLDADGNIVATGTGSEVTLAATAVSVTIKLAAGETGDGGPGDGSSDDGGVIVNDGGAKNGVTCTSGSECGTGFCADGVCCNTACDGVCVSCSLAASKGTCSPYAADTDPDLECAEKVVVAPASSDDAGTTTTTTDGGDASAEASVMASADASGDASDEAGADGGDNGPVINTPPGGFMTTKGACGGMCNGAGACKYPGATKSCGKPFCNTRKDVGSFVCDGTGICSPVLSECTDYACDDTKGSCHTNCSGPLDCVIGDYCSVDGKCLPKKVVSVGCTTDGECKTDHCANNVCCNTACAGTGLSCNDPGTAGQCKCIGVTCAAGIACQVFYKDADNDGFGNRDGTIAAGTAKAGCMGAAPPAGFVADGTDCDDTDAMAHPGQTAYFGVQRKSGGFDYDCDDKLTKLTPEYPGGSCKFCGAVGSCSATTTACGTAGQAGAFQCPQEGTIFRTLDEPISIDPIEPIAPRISFATPSAAAAPTTGTTTTVITPPPVIVVPCKACIAQCCGCQTNDRRGFLAAVPCGNTANVYSCGTCAAVGGGSPLTSAVAQQTCR